MKNKITTKVLAEIAIMAAVAFALDALQGGVFRGLFPNGGSIGIAMLPILILTYRRGFLPGLLSALILSFIQMLGGIYTIADSWYMVLLQVLLDYVLAYPLVCFAGFFVKGYRNATTNKQKALFLILGAVVGGVAKFLAHYLAGVIFWSSNCPTDFLGGPAVYSLVYNGEYMLPNIVINAGLLCFIGIKYPNLFLLEQNKGGVVDENKNC